MKCSDSCQQGIKCSEWHILGFFCIFSEVKTVSSFKEIKKIGKSEAWNLEKPFALKPVLISEAIPAASIQQASGHRLGGHCKAKGRIWGTTSSRGDLIEEGGADAVV